jgi:hypothetical protein
VRRSLRFLACTGAILLWLLVMTVPFAAAALAIRGEIEIGGDDGRRLRLFLIQERTADGVGLAWSRPEPADLDCRRTTVTYLMWRGTGENVTYCLCQDPATGEISDDQTCP